MTLDQADNQPTAPALYDGGAVACDICGCTGNSTCGHNPPGWALEQGIGCALMDCGICPCCMEKRNPADRRSAE